MSGGRASQVSALAYGDERNTFAVAVARNTTSARIQLRLAIDQKSVLMMSVV
jgi:hypothetical protein